MTVPVEAALPETDAVEETALVYSGLLAMLEMLIFCSFLGKSLGLVRACAETGTCEPRAVMASP